MSIPAVTIFGGVVATRQFGTRLIASGTLSLAAATAADYPGQNARQDRRQIVITNLSQTLTLKIRTPSGLVCATIFPESSFTFESNADIQLYNPSATDAVDYEVFELFYDAGSQTSSPSAVAAAAGVSAPSSSASVPSSSYVPSGFASRATQVQ